MGTVHDHGSLAALRERNRLRVVEVLRRRGTASRADIARATGLSRTTVSSIVGLLQRDGLVAESADVPSRNGGRPPILLALDASAGALLGVDFSHDRLRVAVADLSYRVLAEAEVELRMDARTAAIEIAARTADDLLAATGTDRRRVLAAGVGLPVPLHHLTGFVQSESILPSWAGSDPRAELEERLGLSVHLDNDANVGALGEAVFGAARGGEVVVYVRLDAGVGVGLVFGGEIFRGAHGTAGELGHVVVDPAGPVCRCGNRGCLETLVSGPALREQLRRSHGTLTVAELLEQARLSDGACRRVLQNAARVVGRALADVCNTLNPDVVVLGGELATAGELLLDPLRASLRQHAIPAAAAGVTVVASALGERAELQGALALAGHRSTDPIAAGSPAA